MISKVRRWISRNGWIVAAIVGVLILIVGVGQIFHLWDGVWRALFGTAGPVGGYSCLPTCDERDGKFLSMPGEQMNSFGGEKIVVWISVPSDWNSFTLCINSKHRLACNRVHLLFLHLSSINCFRWSTTHLSSLQTTSSG